MEKIINIFGIAFDSYESFLDNVFRNLEEASIDLNDFVELDHIAYRTENLEFYEEMKNKLIEQSAVYSEVFFNGRNILVCRLKEPLVYKNFVIGGIEVLAPKENNIFKNGLEHAEFVIKDNLENFKKKYNKISFNLRAYNRTENPELIFDFKDCAVKFHTQSLLEIRKIK